LVRLNWEKLVCMLCDQVLSLLDYRATLYDYLKCWINGIVPDLIAMVEEIVGARLISRNSKTITQVASRLPNGASQCQVQSSNNKN
jgi:RNA processing factor Prp31